MREYVYLFTHFIEQLSKSKSSGKWQSPNFHKGLYDPLLWGGGSTSQIHWIFLSPSNPLWEARPLSCVEIFSSSCRVFVLITGHPTKIQIDLFCLFWPYLVIFIFWISGVLEMLSWTGWEKYLNIWIYVVWKFHYALERLRNWLAPLGAYKPLQQKVCLQYSEQPNFKTALQVFIIDLSNILFYCAMLKMT